MDQRAIFFVSDGTALTVEALGNAVLSQFPIQCHSQTHPFIESTYKAEKVVKKINECCLITTGQPIVFHSIVNPDIRGIIERSSAFTYDILQAFVAPLQEQLHIKAKPKTHQSHSIHHDDYFQRINAIHYSLDNDDGKFSQDLSQADIILIGASRSGKTPSCLYLSLQFGIKAANYPLVEDDLFPLCLPEVLQKHQAKLFGLTISPSRLQQIRQSRTSLQQYSSLQQCRFEITQIQKLFHTYNIPYLDTTNHSIEEISAMILDKTGIKRQLF